MFGFGKKRFIGIDIGTSSIKMVELKIDGNKPVLTNYAWAFVEGLVRDNDLKAAYFETVLPQYLKRMIKESKMTNANVCFSIPAFGGLITLIEFPKMDKNDLDQAVRFEAHKYIPIALEEVVLSWDIINKQASIKTLLAQNSAAAGAVDNKTEKNDAERMQVLLVAAPKNKVIRYERLASEIGRSLKTIEIESFSLVRSLIGNDQGNFIIIDIGARVCNIILVEKGIIKANRNIDAGGKDITKTIAKSMNIDAERADKLKVSGKNFLDSESNVSFPIVDLIIGEVARVLSSYYKGESKTALDGIILSGGTAALSGLDEYFSRALNVKTTVGNPLSRIEYDKKLETRVREIGGQFSVAIGLALSGIEDH